MSEKTYNVNVEKKDSEITITGELPWELLSVHEEAVLKNFAKNLKLDGFRKGAVPTEIAQKHMDTMRLLTESAEKALALAYPAILKENDIDAIGRPEIQITKLAEGNPLGFTAKTAVMPEITLPNYEKLAKDVFSNKPEVQEVADEDVLKTINHIRKEWAFHERYEAAKKKDENADPKKIVAAPEDYPELTDEFVTKLGPFTSVDEFKKKLKENLEKEAELRALDKRRGELIEKLIEKSEVKPPEVMVNAELERMIFELEQEIASGGHSFDDYLKETKRTREDLKSERKDFARKRVIQQLIWTRIAEKEKLAPSREEIEKEVGHIMKHYPNADKESAEAYATTVLSNNKVMKFLEEQGTSTPDK